MFKSLIILSMFFVILGGTAHASEIGESSIESLTVGPLEVSLTLSTEWTLLPDASEVRPILNAEGVQSPAAFAIKSSQGAYIYATYGEFSNFAISAREIVSTPPPQSMVEGWGLDRQNVKMEVVELPSGLEGALMRAEGLGSGRDFISSKVVPTVAVWADVPYVFRDQDRLRSGMVNLFFRSPKTASDEGALKLFFDLVDGLRPQERYASASIQEFLLALEGDSGGSPERPAVAPAGQDLDGSLTADLLAGWTDDALGSDADEDSSGRFDVLENLAQRFPANPYLKSELSRLGSLRRESELVRRFLAGDEDGQNRIALGEFHRMVLERQRKLSGRSGAEDYLAYLRQVWPENPIASPPQGEIAEGMTWVHPLLGVEMIPLGSKSGTPFWISKVPVLAYLRSRATLLETLPDLSGESLSWSDACELAQGFGLQLPRLEQYEVLKESSTVSLSSAGMYWARRSGASRGDPAVKLSPGAGGRSAGSVRILRKKRDSRLPDGDFYVVLPTGPDSRDPCGRP